MKTHNIFNHYENESLKLKVKQKNIALKVVHDVKYLTPNKKMKTSHDDVDGKSTNSINTI